MIYLIPLVIEIIILFFLSRQMSKTLSRFMSINFLSFLFLPGIIIHELSHFFMAIILFVPVGEMEFIPKRTGDSVKLGSVEIGKTDPVRRSIIGFAPVFVGLATITISLYFFISNIHFLQDRGFVVYAISILVLIYFLFAVGNTMFSSSRDMEGTAESLITLFVVFAGAYILGFRPSLSVLDKIITEEFLGALQKSAIFLLAPIIIDLSFLGAIRLFIYNRSRKS